MARSDIEVISTPATNGYSVYERIARFLTTGVQVPTFSTAPTLRAGSGAADNSASSYTNSHTHTLSSSIQVGDLIILNVTTSNQTPNLPAGGPTGGWNFVTQYAYNVGSCIYYKFATSAETGGATVALTSGGSGYWSVTSAAYENVWPAAPFNGGGQGYFNLSGSANPMTVPDCTTTVANTLALQIWSINSPGVGLTFPNTTDASDNTGGFFSSGISEVAVPTAGSIGGPYTATLTGTAPTYALGVNLVLQGVPTVVSAPAGGWEFFDEYGDPNNSSAAYFIWKSPGASNTTGDDYYLVFATGCPGYNSYWNGFGVQVVELYDPSTRLWNAPSMHMYNYNTHPDLNPLGSTTPPWSQFYTTMTSPTIRIVGQSYNNQQSVGGAFSTGTNVLLTAANADGLFVSLTIAGNLSQNFFVGCFTSLIANASFSADEGGAVMWDIHNNQMGTTRDPGVTQSSYQYNYTYQPTNFWPSNLQFQGQVNGSPTSSSNDLYQADPATPIAARQAMYKQGGTASQSGVLRGLLPTWIQSIPQSGCAWGDTVTEGSDTLTYVGDSSYWVDTTP